jgi:16S rRNA (guanine966-N2)-methyltransferase
MRIIAGRFRSRKLLTPKDAQTTRPIPDRVKESIFSMLRGNCEGAAVLDAFAGTGAIGLEALSRGAERVVFVERDRFAQQMLAANIEALGVEDEVELVKSDALGPATLARCPQPVDLAFFDPPYPLVLDTLGWDRVRRQLARIIPMLSDSGFLILRTPWPFRHIQMIDQDDQPLLAAERAKYDIWGRRRSGLPPKIPRGLAGRRTRVGRRPESEQEEDLEHEWIGDEIDIEAIEEETERLLDAQNKEVPGVGVKIVRHDVPLALEGAIGPETHPYASMAMHLYMRKKS